VAALSIQREHRLGLERARELARHWAEHAERAYGMRCTLEHGPDEDRVRFHRGGVDGVLHVSGTRLAIEARLGLWLGALKSKIERQIETGLDRMLAEEAQRPAGGGPVTGAARGS
jgi:putative polyhydroxyalkanoate system protein